MTLIDDTLLKEIEAHMRETGMSATAFGKAALRDPMLVHQIRKGRWLGGRTRHAVRLFMSETGPRSVKPSQGHVNNEKPKAIVIVAGAA